MTTEEKGEKGVAEIGARENDVNTYKRGIIFSLSSSLLRAFSPISP